MPGRLLIDNTDADLASAKRAAAFVQDRPVTAVLGGHIEVNAAGETFTWESQYHPDEHVLQLTKDDLLALPAAVSRFNGFYTTSGTTSGKFIMLNSMRVLIAQAIGAAVVLLAVILAVVFYIRRRRRARKLLAA
jgi:hydroxyacylglutathione hydrolase